MSENKNSERKPMYIDVVEPQKFETLAATTLETTQRLAKRINKLLSTTFADYYGAVVYCTAGNGNVANYQQFMVEIHFKPLDAGAISANDTRIRAFKPIAEPKDSTDVVSNLKAIYGNFRTSAKFEMTSEAAEILSEFMMPNIGINPFDAKSYDNYKAEYVDTTRFGMSPVMVKIINLDLTRLIRKIYGAKNASGKKVDYGVIPYGPVTPNYNNNPAVQSTANWRVIIMQIEAEKAFDLAAEFGLIPAGNGSVGPVVTGTN